MKPCFRFMHLRLAMILLSIYGFSFLVPSCQAQEPFADDIQRFQKTGYTKGVEVIFCLGVETIFTPDAEKRNETEGMKLNAWQRIYVS